MTRTWWAILIIAGVVVGIAVFGLVLTEVLIPDACPNCTGAR